MTETFCHDCQSALEMARACAGHCVVCTESQLRPEWHDPAPGLIQQAAQALRFVREKLAGPADLTQKRPEFVAQPLAGA